MKQWYFNLAQFKAKEGFRFPFSGGEDPDIPYLHLCGVTEVVPKKNCPTLGNMTAMKETSCWLDL